MRQLPEHGPCFVCGTQNPHSIGIRWFVGEKNSVFGEIALTDRQQGPPGMAHGGASAALMDEAMGAAAWLTGLQVAARNLNLRFRRPVPLGVNIKITATVVQKNGKEIHTHGEIHLPDGELAVVAEGVFVEAEHLFTEL